MSKSDPSEYSRINFTDTADDIAQKIRKAKTDPEPLPSSSEGLEGRPEAENLIGIFAALSNMSRDDVLAVNAGKQFSGFKQDLTDLAVSVLGPINTEMQKLVADDAYIDDVLAQGAVRARAISGPIMADIYKTIGLVAP